METVTFTPIGIVHSPYKEQKGTPIQGRYAPDDVRAEIEIFPEYSEGLKDIEGFSHIYLIFHFHKSESYRLLQTPYLDDTERGVFAIRSPFRPNAIGLSIVRLIERKSNILIIGNVDILDETSVLDIKPYVPEFITDDEISIGWLEGKLKDRNSDNIYFTEQ